MYDFTGCECPACHKLFRDDDDIVVCPDCGTPYHRGCYQAEGRCLYTASHGPDFEWAPPRQPQQEVACARCGAMNELENRYCKSCGSPMTTNAGDAARYGTAQNDGRERPRQSGPAVDQSFDYQTFYRDATNSNYTAPIDPNETLEGIPAAEWASYIGRSSYVYLHTFKRMELMGKKVAVSLSAMLFGPYYFFYRKAWKPAVVCFIISLLLNTPAYLWLMKLTESSLVAGLSAGTLEVLLQVASLLLLVFRLVCGLYGFYLYKKDSAARIQRIRQQFPDPEKRAFVLSAQGGTSWVAVIVAFAAMYLIAQGVTLLLGPNLDALYALLGL